MFPQVRIKNKKSNLFLEKNLVKNLRSIILAIFLIFISYEAYLHQVLDGGSKGSPSIHALCPYGGLESFYSLLATGDFIKKIYSGTLILFILSVVLALFFRRSFCGLICPFGALQEFFSKIGQKIFQKRLEMPPKIDAPLRYLKYGILLLTTGAAWFTAELWISPYDPWAAYGHSLGGIKEVITEYPVGFLILLLTILGSIFYDRFFCKYLCPMGAFLAIFAKISPNKIVRNRDKCIDCGLCNKACPVNIKVANSQEITSLECINCQLCTLTCPTEGALEIRQGRKVLKPLVLVTLVLFIYFGGIFISQSAGIYQLLPQPVQAGQVIDVEEIKGYMTIEEVANYTQIPLNEVYARLNISNSISQTTKMKELKELLPDLSVEKVRELLKQ